MLVPDDFFLFADVAQLVEFLFSKQNVTGSNPVIRSSKKKTKPEGELEMTREEVLDNAYALGEPVDEANMKKAYDLILYVKCGNEKKSVVVGTWDDENKVKAANSAIHEVLETADATESICVGYRELTLTEEEFAAYTKKE